MVNRSVFQLLPALFGLDEHLTKRDEAAHTVLPLLTLDEKRPPAVLPPTKPGRLRRAVAGEAAPEEPVELDDLQRSLIELTRQLDGHRRRHLRRATPPVVEELPDAMTPAEIDLVVTHFQHEHLGSRERRVAQEA